MSATQEPAREEEEAEPSSVSGSIPSPRIGNRRRRKLAGILEEDSVTSGVIETMVADGRAGLHRLVLRAKGLTSEGGPARLVNSLVQDLIDSIEAINPAAQLQLSSVAGSNSIEVNFYPPEEEIRAARARLADVAIEPGPQVLPDTTLAILALTHVMAHEDPAAAATEIRSISTTAAEQVRKLTATLSDHRVELRADDVRPGAVAQPEWSLRVLEHLDASEEIPIAVVSVVGILQGANSGGEGNFEIVTDSDVLLDPAFGPRRHPGDKIAGSLAATARRQIRRDNLWDTHVEGSVEIQRRRKGGSMRVEGFRLVSVRPRFR